MAFRAQVIADSLSATGTPLQTLVLQYPRLIHAEFMTHREFSRNASSSRAIPVAKMIDQVRNDPAMPVHWGKNIPGMQANEELPEIIIEEMKELWVKSAWAAADIAEQMMDAGLHKQVANRVLEPYQWMHVVMTTVNWGNWDGLRHHKMADPNIHHLAGIIIDARKVSKGEVLAHGDWHLPFIDQEDWRAATSYCQIGRITRDMPKHDELINMLRKVSAARCARVSYLNHEGKRPTLEEDIKLFDRLVTADLVHASPTEHQATPDRIIQRDGRREWAFEELHGNLRGWKQFRKMIPREYIRPL